MELEVSSVSDCDGATNTYDLGLIVHVTNPPPTGLLNLGGNLYEAPAASGSYTTTLTDLTAAGGAQSIGAYFTDLPTCSTSEDATWTAPESCSCPSDLDGDGIIGISDTLEILANFGCVGSGCVGDLDGDTIVGVSDILEMLSIFGSSC